MDQDKLILSINDELIITTSQPLTDYHKKILSSLYTPIIGSLSTNLYVSLFNFVNFENSESEVITHKTLFSRLFVDSIDEFVKARIALEALGLLDVYLKIYENKVTYIYQIKEVADPYDFLTDPILEELLRTRIGNKEFDDVVAMLLVHRYDLGTFQKITASFDEVYEVVKATTPSKYHNYWISSKNNGIQLKNTHFDYECLVIYVEATDLLKPEILRSVKFYDTINRLSFMYGLNIEEMVAAIKESVTPQGNLDYEVLNMNVKHQYDYKNQLIKIKPVEIKTSSSDKLIMALENTPPKDIVENKYGTKLTASEIEMFERLRETTGLPLGVLNVLIIFVIESKNGEIPTYNYFLKVANSWIRGNVLTTSMALDKISDNPKVTPTKKKPVKPTASWYDEYLAKEKEKLADKKEDSDDESLEEIEAFFNKKKK